MALFGNAAMTFGSAAEAFFTGDRGKVTQLTPRCAVEKLRRLVGKITQETDEKDDALDLMAIAALRDLMVPELKQYVDMSKENEMQPFHRIMEEREKSRPEGIKVFKKSYPTYSTTYRQ